MCRRQESSSCAAAGRRTLSLWPHIIPTKATRGDIGGDSIPDYFDKLLRLKNVQLFSRQDKILYIFDITILILYRLLSLILR